MEAVRPSLYAQAAYRAAKNHEMRDSFLRDPCFANCCTTKFERTKVCWLVQGSGAQDLMAPCKPNKGVDWYASDAKMHEEGVLSCHISDDGGGNASDDGVCSCYRE